MMKRTGIRARLLSALLAALTVLTLLPFAGSAAEGSAYEENVAEHKPVSSNCTAVDNLSVVTDGKKDNPNSHWASRNKKEGGSGNEDVACSDVEVIIDLGGYYTVDAINVYTYWGDPQRHYLFDMLGSIDGKTWIPLAKQTSEENTTSSGYSFTFDATTVSYVKFDGTATVSTNTNIKNVHLVEIEVFGEMTGNLVTGKTVTAKPGKSASGSANSAVDGNVGSYWDAGYWKVEESGFHPEMVVDLGDLYDLRIFNVVNYWSANDGRHYKYIIETSIDGETYKKAVEKTSESAATKAGDSYHVDTDGPLHARYVKVICTYHSKNDGYHINELRVFGELHTHGGGSASCTAAAVCSACGLSYGAPKGHSLTEVPAVDATLTAPGNIGYWTCDVCGGCFGDAQGESEIEQEETVIPQLTAGDMDGDGNATEADRVVLARYLAGWDGYADKVNLASADVNTDGKVNTVDRIVLARHCADWGGYETLPLA